MTWFGQMIYSQHKIHQAYVEAWERTVKTNVSVQTGEHCLKEAKAKSKNSWIKIQTQENSKELC